MKVLLDGIECDMAQPRCRQCKQYAYVMFTHKNGGIVCHRCKRLRSIHKSDIADPEAELLRGQSPKWEEE